MQHLTKDQINSLLLGSVEKQTEWMTHIHECETCRLEYESELAIHQHFSNLTHHQPSLRFAKNIIDLLEKSRKVGLAHRFWSRIITSAIAVATVQVFIMLGYLFSQLSQELIFNGNEVHRIIGWNITLIGTMISFGLLYGFDKWLRRRLI